MVKYKCIGCGEIHNDDDYSKDDGDILIEEFNLSKKIQEESIGMDCVLISYIRKFIEKRINESTKLLALFNQGKLTSMDLREHRQNIKDDAGDKLI